LSEEAESIKSLRLHAYKRKRFHKLTAYEINGLRCA